MKQLRQGTKEFAEYANKAAPMTPSEREAFRIASGVCIADDDALRDWDIVAAEMDERRKIGQGAHMTDDREWQALMEMGGEFQRWKPYIDADNQIGFTLALEPWTPSEYSEWVRAEDAIRREAQLLERISDLENRSKRSADLLAEAVGMLGKRVAHNAG